MSVSGLVLIKETQNESPTMLKVPTISLGGSMPTLLIAATKFAVKPTIPTIATRLSPLIQRKVSLRGRAP
jgi:hypothetical protein